MFDNVGIKEFASLLLASKMVQNIGFFFLETGPSIGISNTIKDGVIVVK